jgi:hypothetical protein
VTPRSKKRPTLWASRMWTRAFGIPACRRSTCEADRKVGTCMGVAISRYWPATGASMAAAAIQAGEAS